MPRCVEPQTPRSPREMENEPVLVSTLDGSITQTPRSPREMENEPVLLSKLDGGIIEGKLKERLLSVAQEQYNALQQHLETQYDLLVDAIDELLKTSPTSGMFDRSTATSNPPATPDDVTTLLVTAPSVHPPPLSMSNMAVSEMYLNANHDTRSSQIDSPQSAQDVLEAQVSIVTNTLSQLRKARDFRFSKFASRLLRLHKDLDHIKERMDTAVQAGEGIFKRAGGGKLDGVIGFLIVANSIVLAMQLQWQGWEAGVQLGFNQDERSTIDKEWVCFILEHAFNFIFFIELLARLYVFKLGWFADLSNIFDAFVVIITSIELYILHPLKTSLGGNVSFLRLFRLAKLVRAMRMVRVLRLFRHLRVLVQTIVASAHALLWSFVLLSVIILLSGILMCQLLLSDITDNSKDQTTRNWAWQFYGTSTRSMYTMTEATLSGCWPNYVRPLVDNFSPWYAFVFVAYIVGVNFAIIRIIGAIFLRETLMVANTDADMEVQEKQRSKERYVAKLKAFFREADTPGDGLIDYHEFETILQNPKVKSWLACLELEVHETQALFHMLDHGDGLITYDEFLKGALRLKGQARSVDIVAIMHDVDKLQNRLQTVQDLVLCSMPRTGRVRAAEYLKVQTRNANVEPQA